MLTIFPSTLSSTHLYLFVLPLPTCPLTSFPVSWISLLTELPLSRHISISTPCIDIRVIFLKGKLLHLYPSVVFCWREGKIQTHSQSWKDLHILPPAYFSRFIFNICPPLPIPHRMCCMLQALYTHCNSSWESALPLLRVFERVSLPSTRNTAFHLAPSPG